MPFLIAAMLSGLASAALAQKFVPDLTGTWVGTAKAVVFGQNRFHRVTETAANPPRVRELSIYDGDHRPGRPRVLGRGMVSPPAST